MDNMIWVWLGVIIVGSVLEAVTAQLVTIWFVLGGILALISGVLGAPEWLQFVAFVASSVVLLAFTRPILRKYLNVKKVSTNADRYVGKTAIVTLEINNTAGSGQVTVLGNVWTARSSTGEIIPEGKNVRVDAIEGVKLMVTQVD